MNILFVCTGNTCRSPMAEALFMNISSENGCTHSAFSRGLNVFVPQKINPKSVCALKKFGVNFEDHISRQLNIEDVEKADCILTMTSSHKQIIKNAFPKHKSKVFTLNEKAYGSDSDIEDPYGLSQEDYDKCCQSVYDALRKLICVL